MSDVQLHYMEQLLEFICHTWKAIDSAEELIEILDERFLEAKTPALHENPDLTSGPDGGVLLLTEPPLVAGAFA